MFPFQPQTPRNTLRPMTGSQPRRGTGPWRYERRTPYPELNGYEVTTNDLIDIRAWYRELGNREDAALWWDTQFRHPDYRFFMPKNWDQMVTNLIDHPQKYTPKDRHQRYAQGVAFLNTFTSRYHDEMSNAPAITNGNRVVQAVDVISENKENVTPFEAPMSSNIQVPLGFEIPQDIVFPDMDLTANEEL